MAGGCVSLRPATVNHIAADALEYDSLASKAQKEAPEVAKAIQRMRKSDEHRQMEKVIAELPAGMLAFLALESTAIQGDEPPLMLVIFQTKTELGFVTNLGQEQDENSLFTGRGWRAGVLELLPENREGGILSEQLGKLLAARGDQASAMLLPVGSKAKAIPENLVIITYVDRSRIMTVGITDDEQESESGTLVRYLPTKWRSRVAPAGSSVQQ